MEEGDAEDGDDQSADARPDAGGEDGTSNDGKRPTKTDGEGKSFIDFNFYEVCGYVRTHRDTFRCV